MEKDGKKIKIALVHDFLMELGGAERVLVALSEIFPEAPIYTIIYDQKFVAKEFQGKKIEVSFLQKFPEFLKKRKKWLLPFLPVAPETFNLRDFDLVISSSGAWSKGIVTRLNTIHIAYIHSPMRFVWDMKEEYFKKKNSFLSSCFFTRFLLSYIRAWDFLAADRPDHLLANSIYTQERIRKYYRREASIIYPPVTLRKQKNLSSKSNESAIFEKEKYFLIVSRLSGYKKIDAAIEAFNKLELPLLVVGTGEEEKYLKSIAGKNIKFSGFVSEEKLGEIYAQARAFIFPGVDDFGIAPVEAMGQGIPVLAIRKGGVKETVTEGKTGEFFNAATPEVIADGVRRLIENEKNYDKEFIKQKAGEFSEERFRKEIVEYIDSITSKIT